MRLRGLVLVAAVGCVLGLPLMSADHAPLDAAPRERTAPRPEPARTPDEMPEDLRASIPQVGPSLPRPEVVRALRRR